MKLNNPPQGTARRLLHKAVRPDQGPNRGSGFTSISGGALPTGSASARNRAGKPSQNPPCLRSRLGSSRNRGGRTEGGGCDTMPFGSRSQDILVRCNNIGRIALRRMQRVAALLFRSGLGGFHWYRRHGRGQVRYPVCVCDAQIRLCARLDLSDRMGCAVGSNELARSDSDPRNGRRNRSSFGSRLAGLASASASPPLLDRAYAYRIGSGTGRINHQLVSRRIGN